jgi:HEAT repeat protein
MRQSTKNNVTGGQSERLTEISFILKDLLKVIKVVSMYPEDNPLPHSMKRSFAEKLVDLVELYGDIKIHVSKDSLLWEDEVVFQDRSGEERLAGIFFDTGITRFTFKAGLDVEDVYKLLDILKDYLNSPHKSQDLVAMIWENEISRFTFTTLEDIALVKYEGDLDLEAMAKAAHIENSRQFSFEGNVSYQDIFKYSRDENAVVLPDDSGRIQTGIRPGVGSAGVSAALPPGSIFGDEGDDGSLQTFQAAQAMGLGDLPASEAATPNTALILNSELLLSKEDEQQIATLLEEDASFNKYESAVQVLKEIIQQEIEINSFNESVTICEKVMTELIESGRVIEAGQILTFLQEYGQRIEKDRPLWAERIKDAYIVAGSRDHLAILAKALNDHSDLGVGIIRQYLDNFGWEALSGLTDLLGDLKHKSQREALCDYLASKGQANIKIVSKGLFDRRTEVVCNSITVLARIGDDTAFDYLGRVTKHKEKSVRLQLARSLKDSPGDKAIAILKGLAIDRDPEIRRVAVESLVYRKGRTAFEAIADIINDERFIAVERSDQKQLLNAFSSLGGELAVSYLGQLILKANPLGNSTLTFYRQAAFESLSLNKSEKAERLLVKLSGSWRPNVRAQARHTLQQRRHMLYGGEQ